MKTPPTPRLPPPLFILIALAAIGPMALNIFVPSMPGIRAVFGVDYGTVQLTLTLYLVGVAVAQIFIGSLSDRFGRRPVLLSGVTLFIGGSIVCASATSITMLIMGRVIQAVGGCAGMVLSRAIARDIHDHSGATRMVAYIAMSMVVVPMIAPALGGYLQEWFDWRASFWFVTGAGVLALAGAWPLLSETHFNLRPMPDIAGILDDYRNLLRSPCFCGFAFNAAFSSAMFFSFLAGAPYIMVEVFELPPSDYGLWFVMVAAGYMAGNFVTARLSPSVGGDTMIRIGSLLGVVAVALMFLLALAGLTTPAAIFVPMVVVTFCNGLNLPNAMVGAVSVKPAMAGTASGLAGFLQMGVGALATIVVGNLQDDTQLPMIGVMLFSALAALASFTLALRTQRRLAVQ